uniref:Organic cation transporter protein n=1 Tax=Timema poppense TaxID=170557 RepID=A0A7R9H5Q7_TIMPO|nr:unnamed protein product [Timema poppensis]
MGHHFGKTNLGTLKRDSNPDSPIIGSLVYCEGSALDHAATEATSMATTATPNGGPVKTTLKDSFGSSAEEEEEDDPVSQAVGEFGRWQLQLTFLLSLFNVPCTFHIFAVTFQAPVVDFWCARPPGFTEMDVPTWRNMSHSVVLSQVRGTKETSVQPIRILSLISLVIGDRPTEISALESYDHSYEGLRVLIEGDRKVWVQTPVPLRLFTQGGNNVRGQGCLLTRLHTHKPRNGALLNGTPEYDACAVWDMDYNNTAINNVATTNITRSCTDWEFSRDEFGDTIISQWNLVCDKHPTVLRFPQLPYSQQCCVVCSGTWCATDRLSPTFLEFPQLSCSQQCCVVCMEPGVRQTPNGSRVPSTPLFTAVLCCLQWNLVCDIQALPNGSRVPSTPLFTAVLCCLQWNLVCDRQALPNVAEMMFLAGVALGGLISGMISDRFGRKKTLMGSLVLQICIALSMTFCPWFEVYVALRFCLGFISVGVVFSGFVLCMELVGGKWRTISGVSYLFPVPLSYIAIAGIAYYVRGWKNLQLAITLPSLLLFGLWCEPFESELFHLEVLLSLSTATSTPRCRPRTQPVSSSAAKLPILPESPRWLLAMGRKDEVMVILKEAARVNKRQLPANTDKILQQVSRVGRGRKKVGEIVPETLVAVEQKAVPRWGGKMMDMKDPGDEKKAGILDLFRTPNMRKTSLILYIIWFSVYLVYYGLVLNLGKIGGNVYLNTILSGVVEIPAIAISILILLKMGRRGPFCLTLMVSGAACFLTLLVPLGRSYMEGITLSLTPLYNHLDVVTGSSDLEWITVSFTPLYNHLGVVTGHSYMECITISLTPLCNHLDFVTGRRSDLEWITISLAMLGKFAVSSSNAVMPVFTAELFPTVVRNLGVGSSNVSAGVALMLVPYLWNLTDIDARVPMGVLGVFGIVGGLSVLLLPETANRPLAETLQEGEDARVMERRPSIVPRRKSRGNCNGSFAE